jgi:hypothetical protein
MLEIMRKQSITKRHTNVGRGSRHLGPKIKQNAKQVDEHSTDLPDVTTWLRVSRADWAPVASPPRKLSAVVAHTESKNRQSPTTKIVKDAHH